MHSPIKAITHPPNPNTEELGQWEWLRGIKKGQTQHSSPSDPVDEECINCVAEWTYSDPTRLNQELLDCTKSETTIEGWTVIFEAESALLSPDSDITHC